MPTPLPTVAFFKVRFPEFVKVSDERIEDAISGAALECNEDQYRALYIEAVLFLAADRIASGPYGQPVKSKDAGVRNPYQQHYQRVQSLAGGGFRIL